MPHQNIKVLLIEDDPDDIFLIRDLFADIPASMPKAAMHFQVTAAENLQKGLDMLKNESFDVVILDLLLTEAQGFDALIKVQGAKPDIPIVVLTGLDDEYIALEALSHGAQDYLVKGSINGPLLARSVRYAIERGQLLSRLEQSSEDRFLKIIDKSVDAIAVIDNEGIVRFVNPSCAALFEQSPKELIGKPFPLSLATNPMAEVDIILKNGVKKLGQMRFSEIEWEKRPAKLALIRDMTTMKKLEMLKRQIEEHKRLDQLKDGFISTVSHELRTPLTTVKSVVENLKDGISGELNEKQKYVVDIANRNVNRLARIINDLLDLSRLESGRAKLNRRPMDIIPVLKEGIQNFQMTANVRNIDLQGKFPNALPAIYVDSDLFMQVLNNLLDNALRFAKSKVLVEAQALEKDVEISVIDDGPGIPRDKMGSIFNKFIQLDRPVGGEGYKGTGLGLAICKEIIEHHKGKIWVDSDAGHGARFNLILQQYQEATDLQSMIRLALKGSEETATPLTLFVLIFSHFETLKKQCGEKGIKECFERLEERIRSQALRKGDILLHDVERGQIFVLAMTIREGAISIGQRIQKTLQDFSHRAPGGEVIPLFKMGTATFPDDGAEPQQLMDIAFDRALEVEHG